tara:strand:- start:799 stop:1032 length:234 start_codon:yes stop_codon:yes gene_type:complete
MRIIRFFSNLTKFKSPKKYKTKIPTINNLNETNYQNIDMNDLDYSDNFWKNSEKNTQKNSYKKNITFVLVKTYYNEF